jgi:hypothetical protein
MHHGPFSLLSMRARALVRHVCPRCAAPLAASLLLACSERGQVVVLSDTTASELPLVVVALPTDPSKLSPATPDLPSGARGGSVRLALALTDSAARLDSDFQRLRTSLNDEARAMFSANKHQAGYARAFDHWSQRAADARSLRAARDKIRKRVARIAERFPDFLRKVGERRVLPRTLAAEAAAREGLEILEAPLSEQGTILRLRPGDWWIAADSAGSLRLPAHAVTVEPGSVDTVSIEGKAGGEN